MKKLRWYLARIKKMTFQEIFHRLKEIFLVYFDFYYFKYFSTKPLVIDFKFYNQLNKYFSSLIGKKNYLIKYEDSKFNCLKSKPIFAIDYRIGNSYGDFRAMWEANRFNDLPMKSLEEGVTFLQKWQRENKPLYGPNYISTMECAIRTINLYLFIVKNYIYLSGNRKINDELGHFLKVQKILISHRISKYSSEGNHTLFEIAGLLCIAVIENDKENLSKWKNKFEQLYLSQTFDDGGGKEQAIGYHYANTQLANFICEQLTRINEIMGREFSLRVSKSKEFIANFYSNLGIVRFGDWDDGVLFNDHEQFRVNKIDNYFKHYNDSGYLISQINKTKIIVDCGELGLPPMFGHSHFDFLSIQIIKKGKPVTYDSSTFLYNQNKSTRATYRSSEYQNSTYMQNSCNNKQLTGFMWSQNDYSEAKVLTPFDVFELVCHFKTDAYSPALVERFLFQHSDFIILCDLSSNSNEIQTTKWRIYPEFHNDFSFHLVDLNSLSISEITPTIKIEKYSKRYTEEENIEAYILRIPPDKMLITTFGCFRDINEKFNLITEFIKKQRKL